MKKLSPKERLTITLSTATLRRWRRLAGESGCETVAEFSNAWIARAERLSARSSLESLRTQATRLREVLELERFGRSIEDQEGCGKTKRSRAAGSDPRRHAAPDVTEGFGRPKSSVVAQSVSCKVNL